MKEFACTQENDRRSTEYEPMRKPLSPGVARGSVVLSAPTLKCPSSIATVVQSMNRMNDPLILRGLVQIVLIAAFFVARYIIDAVLTCGTVDAIARSASNGVLETARVGCPLLRVHSALCTTLLALQAWRFWNAEIMQRGLMWACSLRLVAHLIMSDDLVIGQLTKGDVWPQLASLVTFLRVSSGRTTLHPKMHWRQGCRRFLCMFVPWAVRAAVATYVISAVGARGIGRMAAGASLSWDHSTHILTGRLQGDLREDCVCPGPKDRCTTFSGQPLACHELQRARAFNRDIMPTMQLATYRAVRRAMTEYGLYGSAWQVGHACPDPDKRNTNQREDHGWNLLAQHPADNVLLGHCLVSCAEAKYLEALHVNCTHASNCIPDCSDLLEKD